LNAVTAPLKARLFRIIDVLSTGLLERDVPVRLALLAALAGEHLLLVGPPGTAKSDLARRLSTVFKDATYFERLLTRFSVPEELFGPLSLASLEHDRYERQIAGYLPSASIAFIDEIFKANSAILNALLTLLNEREFDQGTSRIRTPLISVVAASNEIPDEDFLAAFYDRFLLRCAVRPVSDDRFCDLLQLPEMQRPNVPATLQISRDEWAQLRDARDGVALPLEVTEALSDLRAFLQAHDVHLSDRRWRRIIGLLKTAALSNDRSAISVWDLWLLQFCAVDRPDQAELVGEWFSARLGTSAAVNPERFTRVVEAFDAQLALEQNANDLVYDQHGKLALAQAIGGAESGDAAPRLSGFIGKRRYGQTHILARVAQVDELIDELDAFAQSIDGQLISLAEVIGSHLWVAPQFEPQARASLEASRLVIHGLRQRCSALAAGFSALPMLDRDPGVVPEPMAAA
jgi:MoxR-like ATPase